LTVSAANLKLLSITAALAIVLGAFNLGPMLPVHEQTEAVTRKAVTEPPPPSIVEAPIVKPEPPPPVTALATPNTVHGASRVIDGDTIIINGVHIRLSGLDAEELSMTNGPKSAATMRDIVGEHVITCHPDGTRSYNRIVATCYLPDGTDIARELVRRGWGLDCFRYSHGRYRSDEPNGARQKLFQARLRMPICCPVSYH
jgi:micrococcal nuclease